MHQLFGYHRFDKSGLVPLMNDLYRHEWSDYQNHFIPTMKCIDKIKVVSKYKKKFDRPKIPYHRVLECADIDNLKKENLIKKH